MKRSGGPDLVAEDPKNKLLSRWMLYQIAPWGSECVTMNDSDQPRGDCGLVHVITANHDGLGLWTWMRLFGPQGTNSYSYSDDPYRCCASWLTR